MKNTIKFLFVALVMTAMISCGGGKSSDAVQDTTAQEAPAPAPDTTAVQDTTAAPN
jgi:hypothetical protein